MRGGVNPKDQEIVKRNFLRTKIKLVWFEPREPEYPLKLNWRSEWQ